MGMALLVAAYEKGRQQGTFPTPALSKNPPDCRLPNRQALRKAGLSTVATAFLLAGYRDATSLFRVH